MGWRTNSAVIALRSGIRSAGLRRPLSRLLLGKGYENAFHEAMIAAVKPGFTVWDIGANIGYYTREFAERAGPAGRIFAFEPSPTNIGRLSAATEGHPTVTIVRAALGAKAGTMSFTQGEDDIGATSRIVESGAGGITVAVETGDGFAERTPGAIPNFMKIDVEGFELDVLMGMERTLRSPEVKVVCVEVHFGLSAGRGLAGAPAEVEKRLKEAGFAVKWTDPSHIVATRG